nr:MAG TPA: hypothetical protein [Caudoviricetes sp.]
MVSNLAFRIIKSAIKIRLDRQEDTLENLVNIYTKLSEKQKKELLEYFKDYQAQS